MRVIETNNAPKAIGPYSQAILVDKMLFCSGQIPLDNISGEVVGEDIVPQTEQVMKNIGALLNEAGVSFDKVVKTTCFLSDMEYFTEFNEIYARYFVSKPARSCVAAKQLPKNVLVEVEVIAFVE